MTDYTVWNNTLPSGTTSTTTGNRSDSTQFTVNQSCTLTGIAFYVPAGETNLTGSSYGARLYTTTNGTTGTLVASQAGSGTFTAGAWNWIPMNVALSSGVTYVGVINFPNTLQFKSSYWSTGPAVDSGPIHVPTQAAALGNVVQGFVAGDAFPGGVNNPGTWYGVDVKVTVSNSVTGTANVTLKKLTVSGSGVAKTVGTADVTLKKLTVSGSGVAKTVGTADVTLKKLTTSGIGHAPLIGTGAITLKKIVASGSGKTVVFGNGAIVLRKIQVSGRNTPNLASPFFIFSPQ